MVFTLDESSYLSALLGGHVLDSIQRCQALLVDNVHINT